MSPDMASAKKKDPRYFLLDTVPTAQDKIISGCRLPTRKQVLLCFIAHKEDLWKNDSKKENKVMRGAANETMQLVSSFYEKANIPTLAPNKISEEILKLYEEFKALMKISPKRRSIPGKTQDKIKLFKEKLTQTMKFWPKDVFSRVKNDEDREFLESMMTDRKASMGGIDKILAGQKRRREQRDIQKNQRKEKEEHERAERFAVASASHETENETEALLEETEFESNFEPVAKRSHKRSKKTGDCIHVPPDILKSEKLVSTAVRNNISPTALAATVQSLVEACKGDTTKINLSESQSRRYIYIFVLL